MDRIENILSDILERHRMLPPLLGTVEAWDEGAQRATVRVYDGDVSTALTEVPLLLPCGGDWDIVVHPVDGDGVLVLFCGHEIYHWLTGSGPAPTWEPPRLAYAVALPVVPRRRVHSAGTSAGITLRKSDGSVQIEMTSSGIAATGDLDVDGEVSVSGDITASGNITAGTATPATQVSLLTHTHTGVTTGSGSTGTPTPGS